MLKNIVNERGCLSLRAVKKGGGGRGLYLKRKHLFGKKSTLVHLRKQRSRKRGMIKKKISSERRGRQASKPQEEEKDAGGFGIRRAKQRINEESGRKLAKKSREKNLKTRAWGRRRMGGEEGARRNKTRQGEGRAGRA